MYIDWIQMGQIELSSAINSNTFTGRWSGVGRAGTVHIRSTICTTWISSTWFSDAKYSISLWFWKGYRWLGIHVLFRWEWLSTSSSEVSFITFYQFFWHIGLSFICSPLQYFLTCLLNFSLEIREHAIDRLVRLYKDAVYKTGVGYNLKVKSIASLYFHKYI